MNKKDQRKNTLSNDEDEPESSSESGAESGTESEMDSGSDVGKYKRKIVTRSMTRKRHKPDSGSDSDSDYEPKPKQIRMVDLASLIAEAINSKNNTIKCDEKHSEEMKKIQDNITYCPTETDIIETDMCFSDKCSLIEKLRIYNHIPPHTHEKAENRRQIIKMFKNYTKAGLEDMENELKSNDDNLKSQILSLPDSYKNKKMLYEKYQHLQELNPMSSEYPKLTIWIKTALKMPYKIISPQNFSTSRVGLWTYLKEVRAVLDANVYGMDKAKEQVICVLNSVLTGNGKTTGFAMVGPQGVGKTELAYALSKAISMPFVAISMGGICSGEFFNGISYSYEGSQPGEIFNAISQMKQLNGILFMDEIDKISKTKYGDEVSKLLLHITDATQNHNFTDKYLGNRFVIDLSNIMFVYSMNYIEMMNKTLRDRISVIYVDGYTTKEKIEISKKYIIPKIIKNLNIGKYDIKISDETLMYIIRETNKKYSAETSKNGKSGVRQLKHCLETIFNKTNLEITKNNVSEITITLDVVKKYNLFQQKSTFLSMYV